MHGHVLIQLRERKLCSVNGWNHKNVINSFCYWIPIFFSLILLNVWILKIRSFFQTCVCAMQFCTQILGYLWSCHHSHYSNKCFVCTCGQPVLSLHVASTGLAGLPWCSLSWWLGLKHQSHLFVHADFGKVYLEQTLNHFNVLGIFLYNNFHKWSKICRIRSFVCGVKKNHPGLIWMGDVSTEIFISSRNLEWCNHYFFLE